MSDSEYIRLEDLSKEVKQETTLSLNPENLEASIQQLVGLPLKEVERKVILATLAQYQGHRRKTAEVLGISERGLREKLKLYKGTIEE
ncbi:helix-turn-helix domain-containing protein [Caldalkalibacillus mannanilyticus]|uniref:helix-turn-helix domain-containing protein n=1 Tax=Caldalkalibacillus mannanilyticus TaxID=1418 RepID=UPI000AE276A6